MGHGGGMKLKIKVTLAIFIVQSDLNLNCLNGTTCFSSNDSLNGGSYVCFKASIITNSAQNLCRIHEDCRKFVSNFMQNSIKFSGDRT